MMSCVKYDVKPRRAPRYLGIEGGGTRTVALLEESDDDRALRIEAGPANLRLLTDEQLARHFRDIAQALPKPTAMAIGMAGARTESDRERIRRAAARAWPDIPCYATNDLETALMAAEETPGQGEAMPRPVRPAQGAAGAARLPPTRVLVLSGTGSCCFGRTRDGQTAKVGGWGHLLGDKGSGYEIGLRALKAVVYYFDCDGKWPRLGRRLLRALQLNEPDQLIDWARSASKTDLAALAVEVFRAWSSHDRIAADVLEAAAESLARDAVSCARRLAREGGLVQFVLAGSVLLKQPRFARMLGRELKRRWKGAIISPLKQESVRGAVALAEQHFPPVSRERIPPAASSSAVTRRRNTVSAQPVSFDPISSLANSATEQRHPLSFGLDRLSLPQAIALMLREDERIPAALLAERKKIEQGVNRIVRSFRQGGRLFYVGAGTSGRLGVLDASECPPTFRTDPELVQGLIAGGQHALWEAVEGAEDDPGAGARAVVFRGVGRRDTVVGISASGRTPFVWGALREAGRRGATTLLLCFNPNLVIPRADRPTLVIAPKIGPELLTGSTRLKAGTATKLILNMFTTLAMVRMGKVLGNLMIDVKASNSKLRDRAVRIVRELTGVDYGTAQAALTRTRWQIRAACRRLERRGTSS